MRVGHIVQYQSSIFEDMSYELVHMITDTHIHTTCLIDYNTYLYEIDVIELKLVSDILC